MSFTSFIEPLFWNIVVLKNHLIVKICRIHLSFSFQTLEIDNNPWNSNPMVKLFLATTWMKKEKGKTFHYLKEKFMLLYFVQSACMNSKS